MSKASNESVSSVFVTGATGFVGKMLCHSLVERGYHVAGAVRSPEKIGLLPRSMEYRMVEDIGPSTDWAGALENVDTVVYLAARVHVMHETSTNPLDEFRRVNTAGTAKLLEMAVKAGVRRIIYLSTIKVNGERTTEGYSYTEGSPVCPEDAYAQSKWEAEQILHGFTLGRGIEVVIIRPPLIYGPDVGGNFLRLLNWVNRDIPLPLSRVNNSRSLIYAGNLVDVIATCITHPAAAGETFLVSDGEDISTPDLIRMIAKAMNKRTRLIPLPVILLKAAGKLMGKGPEIERLSGSLCIDSSKIRKVLGWKPPFTMEEGICETVKWYQNSTRTLRC
ncbi:MAG TPA: UDP-glucose 4-epimerase family protein [Candidatus Wunengus sp. YC65]|uniref:UDP-glucose 4-epimerase family protein n=1 Tax=Candidatus Wunengus sp. YC65 TaxID=3367701 RepID=UPI00402A07E9